MKHIESFNPAITACLIRMGLDSVKVLNACNAHRGAVKATEAQTVKTLTTLTGKVNAKGQDKRKLNYSDKLGDSAKGLTYNPAGALCAFSDWLDKGMGTHEFSCEISGFSPEINKWLDRETFKPTTVKAPVTTEATTEATTEDAPVTTLAEAIAGFASLAASLTPETPASE